MTLSVVLICLYLVMAALSVGIMTGHPKTELPKDANVILLLSAIWPLTFIVAMGIIIMNEVKRK